jgi:LysM repeat protein
MAARNPVRFLAPIALLAFAFALYTVVQKTRDDGAGSSSSSGTPAHTTPVKSGSSKKSSKKSSSGHVKRFHRVRAGETPSSIALKYHVSVKTLQQLNPSMDPNALTVGERLRLHK